MSAPGASARHAAWALAAACALAFLWELHARVPQVDDAYISYRYAAQLVAGEGLVYNPGERVEGYTNLLWTLAVAAGLALGFGGPAVGHALGLASSLATLAATAWLAAALLPVRRAWLAGLAPWLVLASVAFARWSTSGLEAPLFAAAATAALAAEARGRTGAATGFAVLATLTRPEGGLVAAVVLGMPLLRQRGAREAWRGPLAYAAFLVALTGFRLAYYGSPVPNTFYAKVGGVSPFFGLLYAWAFLRDGAFLLLAPALLAVAGEPRARAAGLWVAACSVYVVAIGGDALGHGRLLLPTLPALAALAVQGVSLGLDRGRVLGAGLAALLPIALLAQLLGLPPRAEPHRTSELEAVRRFDRLFEETGRERADVLARRGDRAPLVATGAIGSFGYHAREARILDILGLVDATIARTPSQPGPELRLPGHQRENTSYVFARRPDYLLVAKKNSPRKGRLPAVAAIWAYPDLERLYVWDPELSGYRRRPGR